MKRRVLAAALLIALAGCIAGVGADARVLKKGENMKTLDGLTWRPKWVTHLGCLKGCLDYLKIELTDAWLYGACGHAFVINVHEVLCPSGPTAWHTGPMTALFAHVGAQVEVIFAHKSQENFAEVQELTWSKVRAAIDEGLPCYGWELEIPEFYVITGYDNVGYIYRGPGCCDGKGPTPWRKLGDTGIGVVWVMIVKPGTAADDAATVKAALEFAPKHAENPKEWIFPKYRAGPAGFDLWIKALRDGTADGFGTAYNAAVWAECRHFAVGFLKEAKARLGGRAAAHFDDAIARYEVVAKNLAEVAETFPFLNVSDEQKKANVKDETRLKKAVACLEAARQAEAEGLKALAKIVAEL